MVGSWSAVNDFSDVSAVLTKSLSYFGLFWSVIFCGRHNIWWRWRVSAVALRIVNDVSYVTRINHESPSSWQAKYLVMLEGESCCSARCKWRFLFDEDQSWEPFLVATVLFGEGPLSLFLRQVHYVVKFGMLMFGSWSDHMQDSLIFWKKNFPWQTNYLVTLEGESCWSPYCKWRLICDKSQSWESFFVAGTIFGDVGRWQARRNVNDVSCVGSIKQECQRVIVFCIQRLLRGMQITFHVSRLSAMVVAVPLCFE